MAEVADAVVVVIRGCGVYSVGAHQCTMIMMRDATDWRTGACRVWLAGAADGGWP